MRSARNIVDVLLEVEEIDPERYVDSTADKESWLVPHPWVGILRPLGFKLKHNDYIEHKKDDEQEKVEFWSVERDVKLKSGELVNLCVSGYEQPELLGSVGLGISYKGISDREPYGIFGSRPIAPQELAQVMRSIIRRLQRCAVVYDWNSSTRGVKESIDKALKAYEYWNSKRRK